MRKPFSLITSSTDCAAAHWSSVSEPCVRPELAAPPPTREIDGVLAEKPPHLFRAAAKMILAYLFGL